MGKTLILFSGGLNSTVCLFWARATGLNVENLFINYGQIAQLEKFSARRISRQAGVPLTEINATDALSSMPLDNNRVPLRNMFLMTLGINYAVTHGFSEVVMGIMSTQKDWAAGENRFISVTLTEDAMRQNLPEGVYLPEFVLPLANNVLPKTIMMAKGLRDCWVALGYAHSALDNLYPPNETDPVMIERAAAFEEAGLPDPLIVRAYWEDHSALPTTPNYDHELIRGLKDRFRAIGPERALELLKAEV